MEKNEMEKENAVRWVLQKIKNELGQSKRNQFVYCLQIFPTPSNAPSPKMQFKAINILSYNGVFKNVRFLFQHEKATLGTDEFEIILDDEKFNACYKRYKFKPTKSRGSSIKSQGDSKANFKRMENPLFLKDRLVRIYESIATLNDEPFIREVVDYGKAIYESMTLTKIVESLKSRENKDDEATGEMEKKCRSEINTGLMNLKRDLRAIDFIQKRRLNNLIHDFNGHRDGRIEGSPNEVVADFESIQHIIVCLKDSGYHEIADRYIKESDGQRDFHFCPTYHKYQLAVSRLKDKWENSFNHAWDEVRFVYSMVYDKDNLTKEIHEAHFMIRDYYGERANELEVLLSPYSYLRNDPTKKPTVYAREKFFPYIRRVHDNLLTILNGISSPGTKAQSNPATAPYTGPEEILTQSSRLIRANGLEINLSSGCMKYRTNPPVEIQPQNNAIKFLMVLFENKNNIVSYSELAKALKLNAYNEESTDTDIRRNVQYLRRDLRQLLKVAGMPEKAINSLIVAKKNSGYRLNMN